MAGYDDFDAILAEEGGPSAKPGVPTGTPGAGGYDDFDAILAEESGGVPDTPDTPPATPGIWSSIFGPSAPKPAPLEPGQPPRPGVDYDPTGAPEPGAWDFYGKPMLHAAGKTLGLLTTIPGAIAQKSIEAVRGTPPEESMIQYDPEQAGEPLPYTLPDIFTVGAREMVARPAAAAGKLLAGGLDQNDKAGTLKNYLGTIPGLSTLVGPEIDQPPAPELDTAVPTLAKAAEPLGYIGAGLMAGLPAFEAGLAKLASVPVVAKLINSGFTIDMIGHAISESPVAMDAWHKYGPLDPRTTGAIGGVLSSGIFGAVGAKHLFAAPPPRPLTETYSGKAPNYPVLGRGRDVTVAPAGFDAEGNELVHPAPVAGVTAPNGPKPLSWLDKLLGRKPEVPAAVEAPPQAPSVWEGEAPPGTVTELPAIDPRQVMLDQLEAAGRPNDPSQNEGVFQPAPIDEGVGAWPEVPVVEGAVDKTVPPPVEAAKPVAPEPVKPAEPVPVEPSLVGITTQEAALDRARLSGIPDEVTPEFLAQAQERAAADAEAQQAQREADIQAAIQGGLNLPPAEPRLAGQPPADYRTAGTAGVSQADIDTARTQPALVAEPLADAPANAPVVDPLAAMSERRTEPAPQPEKFGGPGVDLSVPPEKKAPASVKPGERLAAGEKDLVPIDGEHTLADPHNLGAPVHAIAQRLAPLTRSLGVLVKTIGRSLGIDTSLAGLSTEREYAAVTIGGKKVRLSLATIYDRAASRALHPYFVRAADGAREQVVPRRGTPEYEARLHRELARGITQEIAHELGHVSVERGARDNPELRAKLEAATEAVRRQIESGEDAGNAHAGDDVYHGADFTAAHRNVHSTLGRSQAAIRARLEGELRANDSTRAIRDLREAVDGAWRDTRSRQDAAEAKSKLERERDAGADRAGRPAGGADEDVLQSRRREPEPAPDETGRPDLEPRPPDRVAGGGEGRRYGPAAPVPVPDRKRAGVPGEGAAVRERGSEGQPEHVFTGNRGEYQAGTVDGAYALVRDALQNGRPVQRHEHGAEIADGPTPGTKVISFVGPDGKPHAGALLDAEGNITDLAQQKIGAPSMFRVLFAAADVGGKISPKTVLSADSIGLMNKVAKMAGVSVRDIRAGNVTLDQVFSRDGRFGAIRARYDQGATARRAGRGPEGSDRAGADLAARPEPEEVFSRRREDRPADRPEVPLGVEPERRQPAQDVERASQEYIKSRGIPEPPPFREGHGEDRAMEFADWFDTAKHDPQDPKVQAAYGAAKPEIKDQWHFLHDQGYDIEPWTQEGQPYKNSAEMSKDVRENKHIYFYKGGDIPADHPLAEIDAETGLSYNDMLRGVHDVFGHAERGYQFGPRGEEWAYRRHLNMFTPEARPAIAAETRMQNSWVNFGKHLRDETGTVPRAGEPGYVRPGDRPYAEQKAIAVPEDRLYSRRRDEPQAEPIADDDFAGKYLGRALGAERQAKNLTTHLAAQSGESNVSKIVDPQHGTRVGKKDGKLFVVGPVTPEQWLRRVRAWIPDQAELKETRDWYRQLRGRFEEVFGEGPGAVKNLIAWAQSQQNTSPSGGMMNVQRAKDIAAGIDLRFPEGHEKAGEKMKAGVGHDRIIAAITDVASSAGNAAKLSDFLDASFQRATRSWVGNDPRGGPPIPIDVWAARDRGFIDKETIGYAEDAGVPWAKDLVADDNNASVTQGRYESGIKFYRELSDYLNKKNVDGGNWTPTEAQAVGWTAVRRMFGIAEERPFDIISKNTRNVAAEFGAFGKGSPLEARFANLTQDQRDRMNAIVGPRLIREAADRSGVTVIAGRPGVGGYQEEGNANWDVRVFGSPEQVHDFARFMALGGQQTSVIASRRLASGKDVGWDFRLDQRPTSEQLREWWDVAKGQDPVIARSGFTVLSTPDGHFLRMFPGSKDDARAFNRYFRHDTRIGDFANTMETPFGVKSVEHEEVNAENLWAGNDWEKNNGGEALADALKARGRRVDGFDAFSRSLYDSAEADVRGPSGPAAAPDQSLPKYSRRREDVADRKSVPVFYSPLSRIAEKLPQAMSGRDMLRYLTDPKRSPGVRILDEAKWTGLDDYLQKRGGEKVTPAEVQQYLRENEIRVEEVVKGVRADDRSVDEIERDRLEADRLFREGALTEEEHSIRTNELAYELDRTGDGYAKFSEPRYQTPGGENYRELLLTLPARKPTFSDLKADLDSGKLGRAAYNNAVVQRTFEHERKSFTAGHYDEPNVLAHVRFNERVDADGKRVLFVEEFQSDWASKGRDARKARVKAKMAELGISKEEASKLVPQDAGFASPGDSETVRTLEAERGAIDAKYPGDSIENMPEEVFARYREVTDQLRALYQSGVRSDAAGVPRAPFVMDPKAWSELAMKRMVRYAAENGFDRIAWTTGEMQNARYDLSKQVDSIDWKRHPNGKYRLTVFDKSGDSPIAEDHIDAARIEALVGKDMAERIEANREWDGSLTGLDLKVGGEGMKGFYDRIIPQVAQKLGRKFNKDAQVGKTRINAGTALAGKLMYEGPEMTAREISNVSARLHGTEAGARTLMHMNDIYDAVQRGSTLADAMARLGNDATAEALGGRLVKPTRERYAPEVHSLDITPQMRESVTTEPQSIFSRRREDNLARVEEEPESFDRLRGQVERPDEFALPADSPERAENLKAWFGDSKVVDEAGQPLKLYHHTFEDITQFKPGGFDPSLSGHAIWLGTDPEQGLNAHQGYVAKLRGKSPGFTAQEGERLADLRAQSHAHNVAMEEFQDAREASPFDRDRYRQAEREMKRVKFGDKQYREMRALEDKVNRAPEAEGQNVIPAYVKIENPKIFEGDERSDITLMRPMQVARLQREGYDGAMAYEDGKLVEAAVFSPTQIKSAIGNRGTYRPHGDIRYSRRRGEAMAQERAPEEREREVMGAPELGRPMLPGEAHRVDTKVAQLKGVAPGAKLSRDAPRTWKSLDPQIQKGLNRVLRDNESELAFYDKVRSGRINDVEVQMLDALRQGRREAVEEIGQRLADVRARGGDTDKVNTEYLQASFDSAIAAYAKAARSDVEAGTKLGRALAARARVMDKAGVRTPDNFLTDVFKQFPDISDKDAAEMLRLFKEDPAHLADAITAAMKPTVFQKFLEWWKSGLVSAPGTQVANVLGNIGEDLFRLGETATSALIDSITPGQRSRYSGEARAELEGGVSRLGYAFSNLGHELGKIFTLKPETIRADEPLEYQAGKIAGAKGRAIRIPLRLLSAMDGFFKSVGGDAEMGKLAYRKAVNELGDGATQREIRARKGEIVQDILGEGEHDHADIVDQVARARKERTFQDDPGKAMRMLQNLRNEVPALHVALPFLQTPGKIAYRTAERATPYGYYKAAKAVDVWRAAVKKGADAETVGRLRGEAMDAIARPLLGTVLIGAMAAYAKAGGMTGSGPVEDKNKNLKRDTNWQPYSFVVQDADGRNVYIPFNRFEPISSLLGIASDLSEAGTAKNSGELLDKGLQLVHENFLSKSYLTGLSDVIEAMNEPGRFGANYTSKLVGSMIPNIVAKGAQALDPVVRDVRPEDTGLGGIPERVQKTVRSRIPGLSQTLQERRSGTGETIERLGEGALGAAARFALPSVPTKEKAGTELENLLVDLDEVPSAPRKDVTIGGKKVRLTDAEYSQVQDYDQKASDYLRSIVATPRFQALPEEEQRRIIRSMYNRAGEAARAALLRSDKFRARLSAP